jgi:hypothetical protein
MIIIGNRLDERGASSVSVMDDMNESFPLVELDASIVAPIQNVGFRQPSANSTDNDAART